MSTKRNLPGWMVGSDLKNGKEKQIRESLKRRPEVNTKKRVREKCAKRMMYWMNEGELMEAALSVLERDHGQTAAADRCARQMAGVTVIPETDHEQTTDSDVSEEAVDVAEQETVPYSKCVEESRCRSASESCAEQRLASSDEHENSQSQSQLEALQVLREIFFS